jgi:hypothetical protein
VKPFGPCGVRAVASRAVADQIDKATGTCPDHGTVDGTRVIPSWAFPFFVYAYLRWKAKRQPFECPQCSKPVTLTESS